MRYGENPPGSGALCPGPARKEKGWQRPNSFRVKELFLHNLVDLEAASSLAAEFRNPARGPHQAQ